ncbi:MAG TPA: ABC transporter permease subunit [Candidatus Saccharimonadales bacterium]|nr:ABC transporter permease subunit [Candidatus Saccharimonadales bacterium]
MRYAAHLRTSKRQNILQSHFKSGLIAVVAFAVVGGLIFWIAQGSRLSFHDFLVGFGYSLARTTIAYIIALTLALSLALLTTVNTWVENFLLPILDVMQSFPSFALFPVLVGALAHYPEVVIISVLAVEMIWPILFAIVGSLKNRREDLEEAATIFGALGWKRLRHFTLPELKPAIITGSIVGWGEGWEFIIGAELLVSVHQGVGHYLGQLGNAHQNALLATGIIALMFLLFIINKIVWLPLLHNATKYQAES